MRRRARSAKRPRKVPRNTLEDDLRDLRELELQWAAREGITLEEYYRQVEEDNFTITFGPLNTSCSEDETGMSYKHTHA